jgi:hypothetical protein
MAIRHLEFEVGDRVYLRVSLTRGVKRLGIKCKLAPCYSSLFPVLSRGECGIPFGAATSLGRCV